MHIVETKNNLVRVSYDTSEENLILSGFMVIKDELQSFIGQIIHLESDTEGSFAVVKLLFNFDDEGVITNYNGAIPNINCPLDIVFAQELLDLLPVKNPVILGELAQQKIPLKLDINVFENKLLICLERDDDNKILIENFVDQLADLDKKTLIIDLNGNLDCYTNKIVACEDFKLPLNYETINFIYEKGLDDAKAETKAMIQEIFLEVQEYVKTLPEGFIPFESFKGVVDEQYEETDLTELVLLKNKLLKYYEAGVFAQNKSEFDTLRDSLSTQIATVFDLSKTDEKIQREMISYAYDLIEQSGGNIYVIVNLTDENSDKKLLKKVFSAKNAYSTLICSYSYKYLKELKQLSKDLILFTPIQQQSDFAGYNAFLSKLNPHEFVVYGHATHHLPLIVKLNDRPNVNEGDQGGYAMQEESFIEQVPVSEMQDLIDEQIRREVDEIYTAPSSVKYEEISESRPDVSWDNIPQQASETVSSQGFSAEVVHDELTEDDLDFIEDTSTGGEMDEMSLAEANVRKYMEQQAPKIQEETPVHQELILEDVSEQFEIVEEIPEEVHEEAIEEVVEEVSEESFSDILSQESQIEEKEVFEQPEQQPPVLDILPVSASSTPIVPIYSAEVEPIAKSDKFEQGDTVVHAKYGKGIVERMISYGSKTLCSINFDNVGRRLLDPSLAEIKKAEG